MSRATKRKHVVRELLEERVQPAEGQSVVRVLGTPGNNLHEVETAEGTRFLASMPPRFRRHIWIKRGDTAGIVTLSLSPDGPEGLFVNTNRGGTPGDSGDSDGDSDGDNEDSDGDNEDGDGDSEDGDGDNEEDTGDSAGDNEDGAGDSEEDTGDIEGHGGDTKDTGDRDRGDRGDPPQ
ncbi:PREDICTED: probable RNA-binding protein EIF1AD [Pseudopodoces humilis]|uniref:probable RNA-binding protein EIF1AD n=1 Tax=Pseudopodoces humilis TaxID=181119 RepID=UPI0006B7DAC4|nr:PREDICTED: probable RNA-binding protein EIF1AD [Pseudopodoces humilis]